MTGSWELNVLFPGLLYFQIFLTDIISVYENVKRLSVNTTK